MKQIMLALALTMIAGTLAFGQSTDDYKAGEFFIGYSNGQVDTGLDSEDFSDIGDVSDFVADRTTFHGFNASGVYNVSRFVGIKGDVSGTYNNTDFDFTVPNGEGGTDSVSFKTKNSLYNFLGGVQIKDNSSDKRFKPFGHALVGAGHVRVKATDLSCSPGLDCTEFTSFAESETGLAAAFGGGIDFRINDKVDFRAIQVDYNPIKFNDALTHNFRFGIGLVFK